MSQSSPCRSDAATAARVIDLLFALQAEHGTTLVLVTHDARLAARCSRQLTLVGGELVDAAGELVC